jgi:hypothetical protein
MTDSGGFVISDINPAKCIETQSVRAHYPSAMS